MNIGQDSIYRFVFLVQMLMFYDINTIQNQFFCLFVVIINIIRIYDVNISKEFYCSTYGF